jgi:hypothetical protein
VTFEVADPPVSCAQHQGTRFIFIRTPATAFHAGGNTQIIVTRGMKFRYLLSCRDRQLNSGFHPFRRDRGFESISLRRGVHREPAGHPLKGSRPKLQRASQVSIKTARAFRSLFTAVILKSVMGKDRSRDASPKRLQRLAPPAAAWGACPLPRDKSGRPLRRRTSAACRRGWYGPPSSAAKLRRKCRRE